MTTWWSVEERGWKQELPHLSDDVIALLAAPVVVSASSFGAISECGATPDLETTHDLDIRPTTEPARVLTPVPARGERRARTRV